MIEVNDIKNGTTLIIEGQLFQVVEFLHVKPGKGAAFMKTKLKNLRTGATLERTFNTNIKFEDARIDRMSVQYLYNAGDTYYFMNMQTYDQFELSAEQVGDRKDYLLENMNVDIQMYNGELLGLTLPEKIEFTVVQCDPAVKGNTATNATKNVKLETGISIQVPMFVNEGDVIRIDTRSGEYMERVKK